MGIFKPGSTGTGVLGAADVFGTGQYAVFTTTGTWTVPEGITHIRVHCFGGGGGGCGNTGITFGGGSGSYSYGVFSVQPGETLPIVVGNGGKGVYNNNGVAGGTTGCKGVTAGGGGPGGAAGTGLGGVATGGLKNVDGADATSLNGAAGAVTWYGTTPAGGVSVSGTGYGSDGQPGRVVIEY